MRVLVCGGRDFDDVALVEKTLTEMHATTPISVIIEGGAKGADTHAFRWASRGNRAGTETYEANWADYGRGAGPIRNCRMLDKGKPDVVVAFPGGRGTADMVKQARARGVRVVEVQRSETDIPETEK